MKEQLPTLLKKLKDNSLSFKEVIEFIETYYQHQPTAFKNGELRNEATQNQGSAKVFSFAQLNTLNEGDTLYLFAEHYQSVLENPEGTDHQNIRQFMIHGWSGIALKDRLCLPGKIEPQPGRRKEQSGCGRGSEHTRSVLLVCIKPAKLLV